jgi:hypothetical protein
MTRFTLYHTITDTLGRVHGHLYALDDGRQQQTTEQLKVPITDVERAIQDYALRKRGG